MFNTYICTNNNDNDRTFFLATQNTSTGDNDKAIEKGFQIVKECCKIIICFPCSLHFKKTITKCSEIKSIKKVLQFVLKYYQYNALTIDI